MADESADLEKEFDELEASIAFEFDASKNWEKTSMVKEDGAVNQPDPAIGCEELDYFVSMGIRAFSDITETQRRDCDGSLEVLSDLNS